MKVITSIILPSIRPQNLVHWYNAAKLSSQHNSWEVVIVSPYNLPQELDKISNIKFLKSDRNPVVAKQAGILLSNAEFLLNSTDDEIFFPNSIDKMVEIWKDNNLGEYDSINGRYREGALDINTLKPLDNLPPELPKEYWISSHHEALRLGGINPNWKISLHFFMKLQTFYKVGGLCCMGFENSVFPILSLCFYLQNCGGKVIDTEEEASWCSHSPGHTKDHGPVNDAMALDEQLFRSRFQKNNTFLSIPINYNHWKIYDKRWERRFGRC